MQIPLYQVDAFASRPFTGNPAAVCPLENWLPDDLLQAIALENNLSETAFFVRKADRFGLRWFTPMAEVDLCGHATLASAHVILNELGTSGNRVTFDTKSGEMVVTRDGDLLVLDFPARPPSECPVDGKLVKALGAEPESILGARDYLVIYKTEQQIRALQPDMATLSQVDRFAVIVTAPGDRADFVSRFFAPSKGIPEDPATGSSHCTLIPYWSRRLGKKKLYAEQLSTRGGELWCEDLGERVKIAGKVAKYLKGTIELSG